MKSLKKTLSLVLVFVLAFGLMISASAFSDDADIQYTEAVNVMTGIGAIAGFPDGSFQPDGLVTRAQAAKMIAYASLGTTIAENLKATGAIFTDVKAGDWFAPYVEYCFTKNIVSGRAPGKFDPNGNVTTYELAKMILATAGYGKNSEYVGASWIINVAVDATQKGVFKGLKDTNFADAATREESALMIFNGIKGITQVKFVKTTESYDSTGLTTIGASLYNLTKVTGIVTSNKATGDTKTKVADATLVDGKITVLAVPAVKEFDTTIADIGKVFDIYYNSVSGKVFSATPVSTTVSVAKDIATAANYKAAFGTADEAAAVVNSDANYVNVTRDAAIAGSFDGAAAADDGTYQLYAGEVVSFVETPVYKISQVTAYTAPTASVAGSVTIKCLDDDALEVAAGATAAITLEKLGSTTANKVSLYEGIKVNDYVYIDRAGTAPVAISKATSAVGSLETYSTTSVTVSGKAVKISTVADLVSLTNVAAGIVGTTEYTFVYDKAGAVAGYAIYTPASQANAYGVVLATEFKASVAPGIANGYKGVYGYASVYLLLADGTKVVYKWNDTTDYAETADEVQVKFNEAFDFDKDNDATYEINDGLVKNDVVKYAVNSSDVVTACELQASTALATITKGSALTAIANKYYTANTIFLYMDTADVTKAATVKTGYANAQTTAAGEVTLVTDTNGFVILAFVKQPFATTVTTQTVAFFTSNTFSVTKYDATLEVNVYGYKAYVNGVETILWSESNAIAPTATTFMAYTLEDGYLTAVANPTNTTQETSQTIVYKDDNAIVANNKMLNIGSAEIITYDTSDAAVTAGGTLAKDAVVTYVFSTTSGVNTLKYIAVIVP